MASIIRIDSATQIRATWFQNRQGVFRWFFAICSILLWSINSIGQDNVVKANEQKGNDQVLLEKLGKNGTPDDLQQLIALQNRIRDLTPKLIEKTVAVQVGRANGSGVIVNESGYILTAAHVAGTPNRKAIVYLSNGRQVEGETLGMNEILDSGLIRITTPGKWPYAKLGQSSQLKEGQWCLGTGHPGGYDPERKPVLRMGRILRNQKSAIITDCALVGGDSGGPLFDLDGNVIGIHSRIGKNLTVNVHVPADRYRRSWSRLVNGEAWDLFNPENEKSSWIGVQLDSSIKDSVRIRVMPDSPADNAGIETGDDLIDFGGVAIDTFDILKKQVQIRIPGERVKVTVRRNGKLRTLNLTIGAASAKETKK